MQPDIVAIATPAGVHCEIALVAAQLGCHIFCEKPLALNATQAQAILQAVTLAGVKHGYGATSRYAPAAVYAQMLLAAGLIGQVQAVESIHHFNTSPLSPDSWYFQLSQGGGALYNDFPHFLGQVLFMTSGKLQAVCGTARRLLDQVPVGPPIHDFRLGFVPLPPKQAEAGAWQAVDADLGYTVMARLQMPEGGTADLLFQASEMATALYPNSLAFYGSKGSLHLAGAFFSETIEHFDRTQQRWQEIQIPDEVSQLLAWTEDPVQSAWHQFIREFVADVRGEGYSGYPPFHDGWVANRIIDSVRGGQGLTALAEGADDLV